MILAKSCNVLLFYSLSMHNYLTKVQTLIRMSPALDLGQIQI